MLLTICGTICFFVLEAGHHGLGSERTAGLQPFNSQGQQGYIQTFHSQAELPSHTKSGYVATALNDLNNK